MFQHYAMSSHVLTCALLIFTALGRRSGFSLTFFAENDYPMAKDLLSVRRLGFHRSCARPHAKHMLWSQGAVLGGATRRRVVIPVVTPRLHLAGMTTLWPVAFRFAYPIIWHTATSAGLAGFPSAGPASEYLFSSYRTLFKAHMEASPPIPRRHD